MPGLILKLRAHERILVNGVVMQNGARNARLIVQTPDARILRLRDALDPGDADTPVKRACCLAQRAVAGEAEPGEAARRLVAAIGRLRTVLGGQAACDAALDEAEAAAAAGSFYAALRALRRLLPVEDGAGRAPTGEAPAPPGGPG